MTQIAQLVLVFGWHTAGSLIGRAGRQGKENVGQEVGGFWPGCPTFDLQAASEAGVEQRH